MHNYYLNSCFLYIKINEENYHVEIN
jgi:hypothetical protein